MVFWVQECQSLLAVMQCKVGFPGPGTPVSNAVMQYKVGFSGPGMPVINAVMHYEVGFPGPGMPVIISSDALYGWFSRSRNDSH